MTQQGKRAYHGRRGPAPIVWLIALAVVIATVVLVVAGLSKKPAPDPIPLPGTVTDNGSTKPDEPDTPHTPDTPDEPQTPENDPPQQTESDEPYIDANGLLQYSTKGHYVQADSYQGGGEAPWNLLLVNDWNPLPAGYDNDVSFTTVSGGKQMDSRITDIVEQIIFHAPEPLVAFCQGIQAGSAIDAFVRPEPWAMPGYQDKVIMAAGTFVAGASIELSADAPIRPPYIGYLQGGLSYAHVRLALQEAVERILRA